MQGPIRILLLSRYTRKGASSRIRSYQYLPYLRSQGFEVDVSPLLDDTYLNRLYENRTDPIGVIKGFIRRATELISRKRYDLVWIEKEIFPWLPAWFGLQLLGGRTPYIVDYDDAQFHRYDDHPSWLVRYTLGEKVASLMQNSALVIAGNAYLVEYARQAGAKRVEILPSVVDAERYAPSTNNPDRPLTIGWIGTPKTSRYLNLIASALRHAKKNWSCRLVAVGAARSVAEEHAIEVVPWSEESEVSQIRDFDIGIMPLEDGPFERGKCGYKLIQYMACGKPVIASPVGANAEIVEHGRNGFLAVSNLEWTQAIDALCASHDLRLRMGMAGRQKFESEFSLQVTAPRLAELLRETARA